MTSPIECIRCQWGKDPAKCGLSQIRLDEIVASGERVLCTYSARSGGNYRPRGISEEAERSRLAHHSRVHPKESGGVKPSRQTRKRRIKQGKVPR